uniref:Uncharacterized protein n=1 Tax=Anthurium amnicola TaxID=1678845 RepID=A0A1D1YIE1_9ARAE
MERGEKELASSSQRKKIEPTFVPQWLKTTSTGGSGSSNHLSGSSLHSDGLAAGISSKNRQSVNSCEHDNHRSSVLIERSSSSYRRSSSSNGSLNRDRDNSSHSRPYSSFGRSNRDKDREKDVDFLGREKSTNLGNGFHDFPDSFISSKSEKDTLRRTQSMISGRRNDSWTKRTGNGTANFLPGGGIVSTISKASFEREFPSLGAEEKQGPPEIRRVSSPGLSSPIQSLPLGSSPLIGGDGWTSALAEVPVVIGGNGAPFSSVQQSAPASPASTVSGTTGLNMAETLAQAPLRARAAPQLPVDTQKLEELAIKQSRQLIPMTPSMPKTSVLNSSEKLKPKGSRSGDFGTLPKVGQQPSPQLVNHTLRGSGRPDVSKPSQVGNFQVLNRERNGISPTARDGASQTNAPRVLNPLGGVPAAASASSLKNPNNLKPKADNKASSLPVTTFMEKRPVTQQNRSEFFNSLRKKTSVGNTTSIAEPSSCQSSTLEKSDSQTLGAPTSVDSETKGTSVSDSGLDCSMRNEKDTGETLDDCKDSEIPSNEEKSSCLDPAEEVRLLRLFGWKENAGEEEETLTAEEIDAFMEEYQKLRPTSKFLHRNLRPADTVPSEADGSGNSGSIPSDSKTEGL